MKKTTLTISGTSAYTDALIEDARNSGRTLLSLRAEPDSRRSISQTDARADQQAGSQELAQADPEDPREATGVDAPARLDDAGSSPEIQEEPDSGSDEILERATPHTVISWNPGSFASTKAAVIEAETALDGTIDEVVVFIDPPSTGGTRLSDLTLGQIEAASTTWITGYAQLLRELGRRFAERRSGVILVVLLPGDRDPLGAMAAGAMEALACTLAAQTGEAYKLFTLRDESGQPAPLARYIIKILDEPPRDSSKLLRHSGRINLFGK